MEEGEENIVLLAEAAFSQPAVQDIERSGFDSEEPVLEVGFYDQSHFTKIFKETFGVTPKQFVQSSTLAPSTMKEIGT